MSQKKKKRDKTVREQVMIRDFGLCRCCGFKADEVHHITPLIFGGEDKPENMVALCSECHLGSPSNKEDFFKYIKKGGKRTIFLLGIIAQQSELLEKNSIFSFAYFFNLGKEILKGIRETERKENLEEYPLEQMYKIKDVDFSDIKNAKKITSCNK